MTRTRRANKKNTKITKAAPKIDTASTETPEPVKEKPTLKGPQYFTTWEAAQYFKVQEVAIKLWVENGHLAVETVRGVEMITAESVKACRFNK